MFSSIEKVNKSRLVYRAKRLTKSSKAIPTRQHFQRHGNGKAFRRFLSTDSSTSFQEYNSLLKLFSKCHQCIDARRFRALFTQPISQAIEYYLQMKRNNAELNGPVRRALSAPTLANLTCPFFVFSWFS